jgi:hypothetical protein
MNDDRLETVLRRACPPVAPSPALTERLQRLEPRPSAPSGFRRSLLMAGLAATGVIAVSVVIGTGVLSPRPPVARALVRIQSAVWNVDGLVHTTVFHVLPDGTQVKAREAWWQDGQRREEWVRDDLPFDYGYRRKTAGTVRIEVDDTALEWDGPTNTLRREPIYEPAPPAPITALLAGYQRIGVADRVTDEGIDPADPTRRIYRYTYPDDQQSFFQRQGGDYIDGRIRVSHAFQRLFVKTSTSLPERQEYWLDREEGGGAKLISVTATDYRPALDTSAASELFDPSPQWRSAQSVVVDPDPAWRTRVGAGNQPLATGTAGGRTVTVRDVIGTETGDILLAYTTDGDGAVGTPALDDTKHREQRGLLGLKTVHIGERSVHLAWFDTNVDKSTGELSFGCTLRVAFDGGATVSVPLESGSWGGPVLHTQTPTPYWDLVPLAGDRAIRLVQERARFFATDAWKVDRPLVDSFLQEGFDPLLGAVYWHKETLRAADRWEQLTKTRWSGRRDATLELAAALERIGRTREAAQVRARADRTP